MLRSLLLSSALLVSALSFSGCDHEEDAIRHLYSISVTNLTVAQPMSPLLAVAHNNNYALFTPNASASFALEQLAEGGNNSNLLSEATATTDVDATHAVDGLLLPGASTTFTLESSEEYLSLVGMLINTNDGFIGLNGYDLSTLGINDTKELSLLTYDAGTEANSENAATVPAQQGRGFDETRDDSNFIHIHAGVITQDDGLSTSALSSLHKFDNPTATLTITRLQ